MSRIWLRSASAVSMAFVAAAALVGVFMVAGATLAKPDNESGKASEVKLLETMITVTARVDCNTYEGRALNCTVDPSAAVAKAHPMRLLLGYTSIEIDGNVFEVQPIPGAELKFVPQAGDKRVNLSGSRQMRVGVVYVE